MSCALMRTAQEILNNCPHNGHGTLAAHASSCPEESHRELAKVLLEDDCLEQDTADHRCKDCTDKCSMETCEDRI